MKTTIKQCGGTNYAYKVEGVNTDFHTMPFGRQLDDMRKIREFMEGATSYHVGCKGKASLSAVRQWIKERKPTQFYAKWRADSANWKDDSVEIFYKD